jgi:hypothetical protein
MLIIPQEGDGPRDGDDLAHPLKLASVSALDLQLFVKVATT